MIFMRCLRSLRVVAVLLLATLGSACSINPAAREAPADYDLGPQPAHAEHNPRIHAVLLLPGVTAPAWIGGRGIVYRLDYQDAARPRIYANSRWTAVPARLLTQRIRSRFAAATAGVVTAGDAARADYALRVELEDFSQSFDAPGHSRVSVRARATLIDLASRSLRAQRTFAVERDAGADAGGAVRALAGASDAMIGDLLEWAAQNLADAKAGS